VNGLEASEADVGAAAPAASHVQLTTGDVDAFRAVARRLFGDTFVDVEPVELAAVAS
jgi:hypothetical protein